MSLTIPNLVAQRPFCYLNFISVAKPQKFGNETYDPHVLASSKTYRKQNKPKKWIPSPLRYMSFWQVSLSKRKPIVEPRRAKPKTYRQAPTHWLKFYEEAVVVQLKSEA